MSQPDPAITTDSLTPVSIYRPHSRYLLYLLVTVVAGAVLAWMLVRSFDGAIAFFFVLCFACAIWSAWNLFSSIMLDEKGVRLKMPLGREVQVDYRQFAEVSPGGRFLPAVVVIYYPLRSDGLIDLDDLRSLNLPAVEERDALLEYLQQRTPH